MYILYNPNYILSIHPFIIYSPLCIHYVISCLYSHDANVHLKKQDRHVHLHICKKYVALIYLIILNFYVYIDALIDDIYIYHDISTFPAIRPVCHIASPMFRSSSRSCRALMERTWCFALSRPTCFPKKNTTGNSGHF